jgi:acetyl esterase/lipase
MKFDIQLPRAVRRAAPVGLALFLLCTGLPALAQDDKMTVIPIPEQPGAIALDTGPLPDAKHPEAWHKQYGSHFARNVVEATLTPFLPDPATATGTAVIVAPGGGFRSLSMENEGWDVARALNKKGVAAFVLKYRLNQTPPDLEGFGESIRQMLSAPRPPRDPGATSAAEMLAPQLADARAAFALVRSRASEWKIDPDRIGMIGFSAGAMLTLTTALHGEDAKPAFIGNVYGPITTSDTVPADAPPMFVALAADDGLFNNQGFGLVESWQKAGRPVEFHYYERGGHGFGMYQKDTTSTGWFEAWAAWLKMHGYLSPKAK